MKKNGFTLIEVIITILIIVVVTALALPYYFNAAESARMTEVVTLWGRNKNWVIGKEMTAQDADRFTNRLNKQVQLKYFTAEIICRTKEDTGEICWEAEFTQKNENAHARYKLVTTHNFVNLACVPVNDAGESFCRTRALDEKNPETIGNEKGYIIH